LAIPFLLFAVGFLKSKKTLFAALPSQCPFDFIRAFCSVHGVGFVKPCIFQIDPNFLNLGPEADIKSFKNLKNRTRAVNLVGTSLVPGKVPVPAFQLQRGPAAGYVSNLESMA
jgi:hypothetical protein